jgi:N-acyl-L-homoserine lactone synthetase
MTFFDQFDLIIATDEKRREKAFSLRHQVYCEELQYEPLRAEGLERDLYDDSALHLLIESKQSHEPIATARVVFPLNGSLPFQRLYPMQIEEKSCEISRLSIRQDFRGISDISKALYFAAFAVVKLSGVQSVFALMEPRLARHIKRTGFAFSQISENCNLIGNRGIFVWPVGASPMSPLSTEVETTVKEQLAAAWIRDSLMAA